MTFKENTCAADLAEMESSVKVLKCLLCVVDVFTKCSCIKPLKAKKVKAVCHVFF